MRTTPRPSGTVTLWLVPREGEHRDPGAEFAELDAAARARLEEIRAPEARDTQLLSRAWLARLLRAQFGPASAHWSVGIDCNGRATLRDAPREITIAFAHGRDTIALAIGHDCGAGLGIDLEDRLGGDDPLLAPVMLSPAELAQYHCLGTGERRRRYLLARWVAKEAYAKALGRGLALGFDAIDTIEVAPGHFGIRDPYAPDDAAWQVRLIEPDDGTAVAVALAPSGNRPVAIDLHDPDGFRGSVTTGEAEYAAEPSFD
ncbi:4'-phosphopantetheinyl transferase [Sphingomonas leidyi]|uniref:4'-phosphopantetheinyl transferase n=1 Tax=Sphingomonas leidyi TaxID=68569 RepID=A0A7X5UXD0_9SPHN|nr:4'-phosphopantetheinyl transferase superfamily protein [Sphingomonas leidyi]NIJ64029.1 4'-phosphopantetheinyl transferase [Sphingomonas leidyi]